MGMNLKIWRTRWSRIEYERGGPSNWTAGFYMPTSDYDGPNPSDRCWFTLALWKFHAQLFLWKVKPCLEHRGGFSWKRWGLTYFDREIHINMGDDTAVLSCPWQWKIVRWDLLYPNGDVYHRNTFKSKEDRRNFLSWTTVLDSDTPSPANVTTEVVQLVDLVHVTRHGEQQRARISLCGQEREFRWHWLKWLPFPSLQCREIDCLSDAELGERASSWKGGMIGWNIPWAAGDTMEQAFWKWYSTWDGK
jgi:hypothetical protein